MLGGIHWTTTAVALGSLIGPAVGSPGMERRAVCNPDNCARQVTGTFPATPATQRFKDCNSFLVKTVIPAPVIETQTSTLSAGQLTPAPPALVTVAQTRLGPVPTYISSCGTSATAVSRYSSACSCWSGVVTTSTTFAATPTVTTTTYLPPAEAAGPSCTPGRRTNQQGATYTVMCGKNVDRADGISYYNSQYVNSEAECFDLCAASHCDFGNYYYKDSPGVCSWYGSSGNYQFIDFDRLEVFTVDYPPP